MKYSLALVALVFVVGCGESGPPEKTPLEKAEGRYDLQFNANQLAFIRTLKASDKKPHGVLDIKKDGTFLIDLYNRKGDGTELKSLSSGTIKVEGNVFTMTATNVNGKRPIAPPELIYTLSDDATVLMHKDGTTFLRRTDPKKRAGNADVDAFLAKERAEALKRAEEQKKAAAAGPKPKG
ncbi:MAG TPA: hypothetical protein PKA27_11150 [Fimbriimonadaceae bacterium]|mgnify:CR=1 FL=1|nr:hypothetical protein [Fimbriimonadaceae bacterium]